MPFNKYYHNESVTNQGDYSGVRKNDYLGRRFQISLSYRFGKLKASVKKTETTIENNDVVGGITKGQKQCKMSKQNIIINFPSNSLIDSIKHYLCTHENPPSLFTMLKSAGRFIFIRWATESPGLSENTSEKKFVGNRWFLRENSVGISIFYWNIFVGIE